jgi:hypothetical protein
MPEDAEPDLLSGAAKLEAAIVRHIIPLFPVIRVGEVGSKMTRLLAQFFVERQTAALRAAVVLTRESLGHLALPMVRPACEERIWLAYLLTLKPSVRSRLGILISAIESHRAVTAQQQFLGSKTMQDLGFPKRFVKGAPSRRKALESELAETGRALGWPEGTRGLPSTGWVANNVGLQATYDYL